MTNISELTTEDELREAFGVMRDFRARLDIEAYLTLIGEMRGQGYRLFGLKESGTLVTVAGVRVITNLRWGRHMWIYDLVTARDVRSRGYGAQLLGWVEEFAASKGCAVVALSSDVVRRDTHRFFEERMNYERLSYVFIKRV